MQKKRKIERIRFTDFTMMLAFWLIAIGLFFFPTVVSEFFDPKLPAEKRKYAEIIFVTASFSLLGGVYLSYQVYRHYQSAKEWAGQFYEFNDVQIRVLTTMRGDVVFNFNDVLDALEIRLPADRARQLAAFKLQQQIYGDEAEIYITKAGVWGMMARKTGRLAIRFRAYLNEIPEFRQEMASDIE